MDILQDVLSLTHRRSLDKYSELDREDDFDETAEAPAIQCNSYWGPVRVICLQRREGGLGLTLRGDSPVLVAGVVPGGCAAVSELH